MANNSIALLAAVPKMASGVERESEKLQLQVLRDAAAARAQGIADEAAIRDVYKTNDDPQARLKALYSISPKAAMAAEKTMVDLDKDRAETGQKQQLTKSGELADNIKKMDQAGRVMNYVMKNPTLEVAESALDEMERSGVYSSEAVAHYKTEIRRDPSQIAPLAEMAVRGATDTKDQILKTDTRNLGGTTQTQGIDPITGKATIINSVTNTQSPDSVASNARQAAEGAANRSNAIRVQGMIGERMASRSAGGAGVEPSFDPETIERLARQVIRGDRTGLANIGRGAQGAANLTAVQNAVTKEASLMGLAPEEITAASAGLEGLRTGMRATGNISARVENAAQEAAELAPLALAASKDVARSGLLPFGKVQIMFDTQTNDPALARFATANLGLATAYASAMARGQKATVSDNEHARKLLSEAQSQPAYEAKIKQMMAEIEAAKRAPKIVRKHLSDEIGQKGGKSKPAGGVVDFGSLK